MCNFFYNYLIKRMDPLDCAGDTNHSTPAIGAMVPTPLLAVLSVGEQGWPGWGKAATEEVDLEVVMEKVLLHLSITHKNERLNLHVQEFVKMILRLLAGEDRFLLNFLKDIRVSGKGSRKEGGEQYRIIFTLHLGVPLMDCIQDFGNQLGVDFPTLLQMGLNDLEIIQHAFGLSCYIQLTVPSVLYLAAKYGNKIQEALLANAMCGGNTTHRGAVLGVILGAAFGMGSVPEELVGGLSANEELKKEIEAFVERVVNSF